MPNLPDFLDAEMPGSRFASRPGIAIVTGAHGSRSHSNDGDTGDAAGVIEDALGEPPKPSAGLGEPKIIDGSIGRGASGWVAVLEWTVEAAAQGIVGLGVAQASIELIRDFRAAVERLRSREVRFLINRTGAALIALSWVINEEQGRTFEVEASEEFTSVAGQQATEPNPVGVEPWLVSLVDTERTVRYVLVVGVDGAVQGHMSIPLGEFEAMFLPPPAEE